MQKNNLILLMILTLFCITPAFATLDLSLYSGYIPPSYGLFLNSDYAYFVNNAVFVLQGENYESNGFYHVYNTNNLDVLINFTGVIQASDNGNLFICVNDGNGDNQCQQIGRYTGVSFLGSAEQSFAGTFDLQNAGSKEGLIDYWIRILYDSGGSADSYHYRGYFDIDKAYKSKRNIIVTSANNLSEGIITITLNETITNEFNPLDVIYDNDGSELTLSGTSSTLIFTDTTKSRVYPFYIDSFKGGFYNYSRNTTNTTIIKIFIDENTTAKTLIMYYNYNTSLGKNVLDGEYNFYNRTDFNNNPFVIHQVFSDWRWNQSFFNSVIFNESTNGNFVIFDYYRNNATNCHYSASTGTDKNCNLTYQFINNITNIYEGKNDSYGAAGFCEHTIKTSYGNITSLRAGSGFYQIVYNSSQTANVSLTNMSREAAFSYNYGNGINSFVTPTNTTTILEGNAGVRYTGNYLNPSESATFSQAILKYIYIINNITSSNTIANLTNTTYLSATIGLTNNGQTELDISEFPIYGQVYSKDAGYVSCFGTDNLNNSVFVGSVNIPSEINPTNHNFILPYKITNMSYFYNASFNSTNYYCCFYSGTNSICSSTLTMNIGYQRVFTSSVKPEFYGVYNANNVPFSIYYDYSFNFSATSNTAIYVATLNCINFRNGTCYDWTIVNNPQVAFINTTASWTDTCQDCNGCYIASYNVKVSNTSLSSVIARLFCTSGFNPNNTNQDNQATQGNTSYNQKITNSINGILNFGSGCSSTNQTCLRKALFSNPVIGLDYILMTIFSTIAGSMSVDIFYITLINSIIFLIGNYYTITLILILIALLALGNHEHGLIIALGVGFLAFTFFCFMGWTNIPFWLWIGLIIAVSILYMVKRNGQ